MLVAIFLVVHVNRSIEKKSGLLAAWKVFNGLNKHRIHVVKIALAFLLSGILTIILGHLHLCINVFTKDLFLVLRGLLKNFLQLMSA